MGSSSTATEEELTTRTIQSSHLYPSPVLLWPSPSDFRYAGGSCRSREMGTRGGRAEKVRKIFERFDENRDGGLNREEMAALVVAVNPRVKFSQDQINAILDEVFRTYADFIDPSGAGLSLPGLIRTYDDGAGDVDRDFDALSLSLPSTDRPLSEASSSAAPDDSSALPAPSSSAVDQDSKPRSATSAAAADVAFDETWKLLDDLEILLKRLHTKQLKDGKIKGDSGAGFDAFSDTAGWSRELGPPSGEAGGNGRPGSWVVESGPDYSNFVREVAQLRSRADKARSREEAFDGHMALGRVLCDHHLYDLALASFRRACELQPTDPRAHFRTGNALHALGKATAARDEFILAMEAAETGGSPNLLPQIHVNLGIALEAEGLILAACEHYREAAILSPAHFRALKLLGSALLGVGEYRAAEKALEEAIFLKPDYADAHCDLGSALHALGDDERAVQEFQKAIDLRPGHVDALYNLGGLYMDMGRYQRASEMYTRVLAVWPTHWRAQLNKAVALLGAGEAEEARRALKEAFKMTNRVELYDAIAHMKVLQKKKPKSSSSEGEGAFLVVEATKFKRIGRRTTVRQDLSSALEIRAFQRLTRLSRCDAELLKKQLNESDVPISYSGSGQPEKSIRKAALEAILRKLLNFLKPETFQGAVKAMNERILSVMDTSGSGRVDLGMFFAILAPICAGSTDRRKRAVFDALLWRPVNEGSGGTAQIRKSDANAYIKLLRAVYIPSHGVSDMMEVHGEAVDLSMISFPEFIEMFDEPDWGFGIMATLVKLELGDRTRHGRHTCAICRYPIIGSRFKEMKCRFSLCNRCYSEGKVPSTFKREEYTFKEYGSEAQVMKDKCSCFGLQSKNSQTDP